MTNDAASHSPAEVTRATLIGMLSVLIWGPAIPLARIFTVKIGILGFLGFLGLGGGLLGILNHKLQRKKIDTDMFKRKIFYVRWLCWLMTVGLINTAIRMVNYHNLPIVILINYFWPTSVLLCSVIIARQKITRRRYFILGCVIVISSLAFEILYPVFTQLDFTLSPTDLLAYALAFINAVAWGIYSAISRRYGKETGGGNIVPLFQFTLALLIPVCLLAPPQAAAVPVLVMVLFGGFVAMMFLAHQTWNYGMQHGNVVVLSLAADFIPWLSLIAAHFLLGSHIGITTMMTAFTLVVGAMITRYGML